MAWETRNRSKNITSLPPARIRANSSISRNLPFPIKFIINFTVQPGGIRFIFPISGLWKVATHFVCVCLGSPEIYSRVHANRLQKKTWNIGTAPSLCSTFSTRKLRFIPLVLYGCHISGQTCCFTQVTSSLIIIVILFYWSLVGDKKKATKSTRFYKVVPKSPFSPSPFCFLFKCRSRRPRKVATQFFSTFCNVCLIQTRRFRNSSPETCNKLFAFVENGSGDSLCGFF